MKTFLRGLVNSVIFFGLALTLIGLAGSIGLFFRQIPGLVSANRQGIALEGALVSTRLPSRTPTASLTNQGGLPETPAPTPFQPLVAVSTILPTEQPLPVTGAVSPAASTATATPTSTPRPSGPPTRIEIPAAQLDAPVVSIPQLQLSLDGDVFEFWQAPKYRAAGWHEGSAELGQPGNTVLSGHHNINGDVFGGLSVLKQGDEIVMYAGDQPFRYVVSQNMLFEERDVSLAQRLENARWIMPSEDERLTLVSCWPPHSNQYRIIVVAVPVK